MKARSDLRARRLEEAHNAGLPYAAYYEAVFNRWARIYGPEVFFPFHQHGPYYRNSKAEQALEAQTKLAYEAAQRISDVCDAWQTSEAFWKRIKGWADTDITIIYVRGFRLSVYGKRERQRILELVFFWSILKAGSAYETACNGIGKLMERCAK